LRLLDDLNHAPALVLGQGAGLHHTNTVTYAALVQLVVSLQLVGALDNLLIQRVGHAVGDGDHHGLIHLIRNHQADSGLTRRGSHFAHRLLLLIGPAAHAGWS